MGISIKEPALFQGCQVNGISAETETRCGITGTESACFFFARAPTRQIQGKGRMKQSMAKLDLTILHWMRYCYLTLFEHILCLSSAYSSVGEARHSHLAWLYVPFSVWLNGLSMILSEKGQGFYSWCSSMARAMALTTVTPADCCTASPCG